MTVQDLPVRVYRGRTNVDSANTRAPPDDFRLVDGGTPKDGDYFGREAISVADPCSASLSIGIVPMDA